MRLCTRKQKLSNEQRDDTVINVETQMWEKPRQSTNCRIHYGRGVQQRGYTEATTSCPLLRHTRRLQLRQRPHTLSLSHVVFVHMRYTTTYNKSVQQQTLYVLCPKSYLYIYEFRVIYTSVLSNRSDGSEPGLRSSGSP